jgi:hypothetical protein
MQSLFLFRIFQLSFIFQIVIHEADLKLIWAYIVIHIIYIALNKL